MKKAFKTILSLMLAVIVVVGVVSPIAPVAQALKIPIHEGHSDMWLVDANSKKTASTFNLYGRADYICLKMYQDEDCRGWDEFCFAMYSDSNYKKRVVYYSTKSSVGTDYLRIPMAFDDLKSGTYYVKTYVNKWEIGDAYHSRSRTTDQNTLRKYKIKIVKGGTSLKDMNTVMYGFENTEDGPRIYWYSVPGATGYYLYRKSPKTGKYSKIKTVKDSGKKFTSYVDTDMEDKNCTRYYRVVAYKGSSKTPSSLISLKTKILPTPKVKLTVRANNEIKLSWKEIGNRSDYHIYIKGGDIKDWYEIDEVTSGGSSRCIELSDIKPKGKKLKTNTKYYFTVIADVDGIYTGYNTKGVSTWLLNVPKMKECTYPETGGITVNWTESVGADKYRIYRKAKTNADYEYLDSVNGKTFSYTDKTVSNLDRYYYLVKAYKDDKLASYGGGVTGIKLIAPKLESFEANDNGTATLKWSTPQAKYCNYYGIYIKNNDQWEYESSSYYEQYSMKLAYQVTDVTMTVQSNCDSVSSPYNEEGITLEYRPKPQITDIYAIEGKGAYIDWTLPNGAESSYVYRKTADNEYELVYSTDEQSYFWDTTVVAGVPYTYKIAYSYKGEVIETATVEKSVEFVLGSEKICEQLYVPNHNLSDRYSVKCENASADNKYYVFVKVDGEWQKVSFSYFYGQLLLDKRVGVNEYAIAATTPDGKVTMIDGPSFVIDYGNDNANAVSISFDKTTAKFTWNPEEVAGEEIVIYRNDELLAQVPASEGAYLDETAVINKQYNYKAYVNKNSFLSLKYVSSSNEVISTPSIKVSTTTKGVKLKSTNKDFKSAQFVIGRKTSDGKWKTLEKNLYLNSSSAYVDDSAKSGVEYTYRIKAKPYGCDSYGSYTYVTHMYLSAPKIKKISPKSNGLRIYWSKVEGAKKYVLKYYNTEKEEWVTLKTVSASDTLAYTDTKVKYGEVRTYAVWAINGDYKSSYRENGHRYMEEPEITSVKQTKSGIRIECNAVDAATGYLFYCREKGSKKWYGIGPSPGGVKAKKGKVVYVHENKYLEKGKTYYYKVQSKCSSFKSTCEKESKPIKYNG